MYTICWTDERGDHWSRCDSRREVAGQLIKNGIEDDPDVLIFTPEADDCTISAEDIFATL